MKYRRVLFGRTVSKMDVEKFTNGKIANYFGYLCNVTLSNSYQMR